MSLAVSRNGGSVWEFYQNLDSIWEETRVEPGPIKRGGPAEYYFEPGVGAPERDASNVTVAAYYGQTHDNLPPSWRIDMVAVELDKKDKISRIALIENAVGEA